MSTQDEAAITVCKPPQRGDGPMRAIAPLLCALLISGSVTSSASGSSEGSGDRERGRSVLAAAGGCSCHTNTPDEGEDAPRLAGGRALTTPFGIYYSTNITPDPKTGIGGLSEDDFLRAMQQGVAQDGSNYFPVFPYTSFTHMSEPDLRDLYAYLRSVPAVERENRAPDVSPPFGWRISITAWKWLNFSAGRYVEDARQSAEWNRGAYLVSGPAHCSECHTPRTLSGGTNADLFLAGSTDGPEGELAPNITPDEETGIGAWSIPDIDWYLATGFKPDGDDTQGLMSELIDSGFSKLPKTDRRAIAVYLKSLPPIHNAVRSKP